VKLVTAINNMAQEETVKISGVVMSPIQDYGKLRHFKQHLKIFEIADFLSESTFINYNHSLFEFQFQNQQCEIRKSKDISGGEINLDWISTTFVPADRAAVNLLSIELLLGLNQADQDLPGYFIKYGQLYNRAKKQQNEFDFSNTLGVTYKYENERDTITLKDNKKINIGEASSAIQTNTSMLVVLEHQARLEKYKGFCPSDFNLSVIEEPELNCFPDLQDKILKFIIQCVRERKDYTFMRRIFITTHSPYILTSLNNLMYAYKVGQIHKSDAEKIVDSKYWINPSDVSAYMMLKNGRHKKIIDSDGLIQAEKIDDVSRALNNEFDLLQNIELGIKA
jgi:hypothetical protein